MTLRGIFIRVLVGLFISASAHAVGPLGGPAAGGFTQRIITIKGIQEVQDPCIRLGPAVYVVTDMDRGLTHKTVNIAEALCPIFIFGEREQYTIMVHPAGIVVPSPVHTIIEVFTKKAKITYSLTGIPRNKVSLIQLHADDSVNFSDIDPDSFIIKDNPSITSNGCEVQDFTPEAGKKVTTSRVVGDTICPKFTLDSSKTYIVYVSGGDRSNLRLNFHYLNGNGLNRSYDFNPTKLARPIELFGFAADDYLNFDRFQYTNFKLPTSGHIIVPIEGQPCETKILYSDAMPSLINPDGRCTLIHKKGSGVFNLEFKHDPATDRARPDILLTVNQRTMRIQGKKIGTILARTLGSRDQIILNSPAARPLFRIEGNPTIIGGSNSGINCGTTRSVDGIGTVTSCQTAGPQCPGDTEGHPAPNFDPTATSWTYTCPDVEYHVRVAKCELMTDGDTFYARYRPQSDENGCLAKYFAHGAKGKLLTIRTYRTYRGTGANGCANNTECPVTMTVDATGVAEDFIGRVDEGGFHPSTGVNRLTLNQLTAFVSTSVQGIQNLAIADWQWELITNHLFKNLDTYGGGHYSLAQFTAGTVTVSNPYLGLFFDVGCGIVHGSRANDFIGTRYCDHVEIYGEKGNDVIISQGHAQAILGDSSETIMENGNRSTLVRESGSNLIMTYGDGATEDSRIVHGGGFHNTIFEFGAGNILFSTNLHGWRDWYSMDSFFPDDEGSWWHAFPMPSGGVHILGDALDRVPASVGAINRRTGELLSPSLRAACNPEPSDPEYAICNDDSPYLTFLWVYPFDGGPLPTIAPDFNEGRFIFQDTFTNFEQCLTGIATGLQPYHTCSVDWNGAAE